jgi:hypothetical protein
VLSHMCLFFFFLSRMEWEEESNEKETE